MGGMWSVVRSVLWQQSASWCCSGAEDWLSDWRLHCCGWEIGSSWSTSCWAHYSKYPPLLCLLYSPEIICKDYKRWLYLDDPLIAKILARSKFCLTSRGLDSGPREIENMKTWLLLQSLMGAVKRCWARSNREITMCGFLLSSQLRGWTHYFSTRKLSFVKPFTNL